MYFPDKNESGIVRPCRITCNAIFSSSKPTDKNNHHYYKNALVIQKGHGNNSNYIIKL